MKIFKFFKSKGDAFKGLSAGSVAELQSRRNHPRYTVADTPYCYLKHPSGSHFRVIDISFKGCLIAGADGVALDKPDSPKGMTLQVFGHALPASFKEVQKRQKAWAVVFEHQSDAFVFGLTSVLEPLRCGSTCIEVSKDLGRDTTLDVNRRRYSGDGPFDLVIERDEKSALTFGMATIRQGSTYASILWENGIVITKKSVDRQGVGARMSQTPKPDLELVIYAGIACMGMSFDDGRDMAHAFGDWLKLQA